MINTAITQPWLFVKFEESGVWIFQKILGWVEFEDMSLVEDEDAVRSENGRNAVRDCDHSAGRELIADDLLQHFVALKVDARSGLVDEHHLFGVEQRPRDVDELSLPAAEVGSALLHAGRETAARMQTLPQAAALKGRDDVFVLEGVEGIDVLSKGRLTYRTVPLKRKCSCRITLNPARSDCRSRA